jgi:hypothetical protein
MNLAPDIEPIVWTYYRLVLKLTVEMSCWVEARRVRLGMLSLFQTQI